MRTILTTAAIGAFAFAATTPVLALDAGNQAQPTPVQTMDKQPDISADKTGAINRVVLEPGKNSFTEDQAKNRIESAGFTNVSALKMDAQGIWRGTASKGATNVSVGLDFKGNVAADTAAAQ
jgi:putative membrane protein